MLVRLWHLASLDAPTVAIVWSLAFAWVTGIHLPAWVPILLALAVWSVYVGDRLLDTRSALRTAQIHRLRERHFFHHRHRRVLLPLAIVAAAAAAGIVFTLMPPFTRQRDSLLVAASLAYFTRVHTGRKLAPFLSKELLVGLLFTAGCVLPTFTRLSTGEPITPVLIPAFVFSLLAWLNCHAIDHWEMSPDSAARLSIATPAMLLAFTGILTAAFLFGTHPRTTALLLTAAASALLLALLDRLRTRLTPIALRAAADLVLLTPALLLAFK